jgi:hypothetical protein
MNENRFWFMSQEIHIPLGQFQEEKKNKYINAVFYQCQRTSTFLTNLVKNVKHDSTSQQSGPIFQKIPNIQSSTSATRRQELMENQNTKL